MYCKHCGREIDDNSSYCKYCGKAQDNRVSTSNGFIDFVTNRPIVSSYILWVIINVICLCRGDKVGEYYDILYPKFCVLDEDYFNLNYYQITDFLVYTILIPLVLFLGYQYFKKVTSIKKRILWALWFIFHIVMYKMSNLAIDGYFFPFTATTIRRYEWGSGQTFDYNYSIFAYDAYDLSELVLYTMIIPIAYWGYLYYKDKKKETKK
jgi:hypothetical protein